MADALISLGILFFFAIVGGVIATRFKLPAVLGLLLVGSLIGPNMFNLVSDMDMINRMSEFGAILLLFVIGIEFDLTKLAKLGFKAIAVAILKDGIVFFIGFQTALLLGFDAVVGVFIGIILAFSSTVVIVKILEQKNLYKRQEVPLLMAVLILEDILAVLAITFLSGIGSAKEGGLVIVSEDLVIALFLLIIAYVIALKFARPVIEWVTANSGEEVITFIALGLCAAFAYFAYAIGLTPTAGAFLAGSIVASLPNAKVFEHAISPYTLTFTSLFFIAVGTMVNFASIQNNIIIIEVLIAAVLVSRFVAVGIVTRIFANFKGDQVFFSSIAMFSVGEFALLVAKESIAYHLPIDLVSISSAIIFISALIMAFTVNHSHRFSVPWDKAMPKIMSEKMDMLANYIRSFFDEIDMENSTTRLFKIAAGKTLLYFTGLIFVFVTYRKYLESYLGVSAFLGLDAGILLLVVRLVCIALALLFAGSFGKQFRIAYATLTVMLSNLDSNRSLQKSGLILRRLSTAFVSLFAAFVTPILIFLFKLPIWVNALSFVFVVICVYKTFSAIHAIHTHIRMDFPQYRKFSMDDYKLRAR